MEQKYEKSQTPTFLLIAAENEHFLIHIVSVNLLSGIVGLCCTLTRPTTPPKPP